LNVSGNSISKHGMGTLSKCLASNRTLCKLILSESDCVHVLTPKHLPRSLVALEESGREDHLPPPLQKRLRENQAAVVVFDECVQAGDQVQVLEQLSQGANLEHVDAEGNTVLHIAALKGAGAKVVAAILQNAFGLLWWSNSRGVTPLELAFDGGTLSSFAAV